MLPVRGAAAGDGAAGGGGLRAGGGARAGMLRAVPGPAAGARASRRAAAEPSAARLRSRPPLSTSRANTDRIHASSASARLTVIVLR